MSDIYRHTAGDRTPYTYLIGWPNLNKWYYGVRFAKGCHPTDLWKPYKTSSKYVEQFIKENGDPTVFSIRKTFRSVNQARSWEEKVLKRLKVTSRDDFLNKTDNKAVSLDSAYIGSTKSKPYKNPNDRRRELSRERMRLINLQHGIQHQSREKQEQAKLKEIQTKELMRINGEYLAINYKISQSLKGRYTKLNGSTNNGWVDSEKGKEMAERNNAQAMCPNCGKTGQYRAMKRWHFDNCKSIK